MPELSYRAGALLVALAAILWSLMGLAIRMIETADAWQILFWRSVGLLPALFLLVAWRSGGRPFAAIRSVGLPGLIGGSGLVVAFAGAIYAIQATSVANAVFLFAASPFITALLAWPILREPVRPATWGAMLLAAFGVGLMVRQGLALGEGMGAGSLAALLSAAGFAVFTIALRWGRVGDMLPAVLIGAALAALVALAVTLAGGKTILIPAEEMGVALAMGAVLLGAGMTLYTIGSRAVPAAELTLITMIEVLLAPVWVFLLLGEQATPSTLLGGAVILAAVAANALSGARRRPAANQAV
ncbi:MAG: DMT family transporter [Pikeienuella sp.]|uniref:DMT family transporter n=1 Tax=Pikeienuella sp. TaxID=2831957 RepID=UPI00391AD1FE